MLAIARRPAGRLALILALLASGVLPSAAPADDPAAAPTVPGAVLSGQVCDPLGQPVPGAEVVVAPDGGDDPGELDTDQGRRDASTSTDAATDAAGRFQLPWPDRPARPGLASLWVWHAGSRLARVAVAPGSERRPIVVRLDPVVPGAGASIQVVGPRGEPIARARVVPIRWFEGDQAAAATRTCAIPRSMGERLARPTDAEGHVSFDALAALRLGAVAVLEADWGEQFAAWNDTLSARHRQVWLRPVGRVVGEVHADDAASFRGATVRVRTRAGSRLVGVASAPVDAAGHFEVPHAVAGPIETRVELPAGAVEILAREPRLELLPASTVAVTLRLQRGHVVAGQVRERGGGQPIAGARVDVRSSGSPPRQVLTDRLGQFSALVLPGAVTVRVAEAPAPWLVVPPEPRPGGVAWPESQDRLPWPPIELDRGVMLRGRVVDDGHRPVDRAATVAARWMGRFGRIQEDRAAFGGTDAEGHFEVGPIPAGVEVALTARAGDRGTEPVRQRVEPADPSRELVLPGPGGKLAPQGRVVDLDGRPVAGALVQFRLVDSATLFRGPRPGRRLAEPGLDAVVTDDQGWYRAPALLEPRHAYLASAEAADCEAGRTRPVAPRSRGDAQLRFPDLVLDRHRVRSVLVGQVLGRDGLPVAGVAVRDMARHAATSDAAGWFRLDMAGEEGPAFVFAHKPGYRFFGRSLALPDHDPGRPLRIELSRADESDAPHPSAARVGPVGARLAVDLIVRALVVNPIVERALADHDSVHGSMVLEHLARLEPGRVVAWLDAGLVRDRRLADGLRRISARHLANHEFEAAMLALRGIEDINGRSLATLDAVEKAEGVADRRKRAEVERVDREARSIDDLAQRALVLGRLATAWLSLAEPDQSRRCLDAAEAIAESLPRATSGARVWSALIGPLAQLEPARAQARLDRLVDSVDLDRGRLAMSLRWARRDPTAAALMFRRIKDPRVQARATPELCFRLAATDIEQARGLVRAIAARHPAEAAYATGMMAASLAATDRAAARSLIHEAYGRLEAASDSESSVWSDSDLSPAVVAAALLPTVEAVDPSALRECFWKSVAFYPAKLPPSPHLIAIHALLLDRYDHDAARLLFDPGRLNAALLAPADLTPLILAAAQIAPEVACRWVLARPDPATSNPDLPLELTRAHLQLVAALTATDHDRWRRATNEILHLWTPGQGIRLP